jgi:starvation-inducible DNA-binding protein
MRSMSLNIGLSEERREGVVRILNTLLADEYLLYTKTRNYHWNVVGPQFNDLHKFFEAQYTALNEIVDDVAERARTVGGNALGTMAEFLKYTRLTEQPGHYPDARDMIADLLADHEALICHLRVDLETCVEKYHDAGTNDFLIGLMEQHEKMAWMLRAFLEGK